MEENLDKIDIFNLLVGITGDPDRVQMDVPMSEHTTFRTGGPADLMVQPSGTEELVKLILALRGDQVPYYILGRASNVLVTDKGYRGVIINIDKEMAAVSVTGNTLTAQAGASLSTAARVAYEHSLQGMEFASGIPGSVGGAVYMNAGAYGGEMKQILSSVTAVTEDGKVVRYGAADLDLGYRHSIFENIRAVITEATMTLRHGKQQEIMDLMKDLAERRRAKQPLNLPSAGSTFKRPPGHFAGQLIDEAQMRGASVGGAQVSPKHAGFIVNNGGATSRDILELIALVQMRVKENSGIDLEREVRVIGED
ncbi:MAG: UDP-N-acetylmuramate dehydrogenase [Firmicutes bacterium]|nr:UDP-N-acetylmuramate dehydrogenase [Bacillota bacterium]